MRFLLITAAALLIFLGCSAKEFKEGAEGIKNDITNAFEGSKD
ncbi:hypothetical protein [Sulfurimonas crateris]|nr:hypothetical protein [Sulfurimonas crateris]